MKKILEKCIKNKLTFILFFLPFSYFNSQANKLDTVQTGIYITSIHDINFVQNEYTTTCWIWFNYHRREFNFIDNIEIPQAKSFTKTFVSIDSTKDNYHVLMKIEAVMKDNWKTNNFPFDCQKLRFSIENSQFDTSDLIFSVDTSGQNYNKKFTLKGWNIDSCIKLVKTNTYQTTFGFPSTQSNSKYSEFLVKLMISRTQETDFGKYLSACM